MDPEERLNLLAGSHLSNNVSEGTQEASDDDHDSESMFNSSQSSVDSIYVSQDICTVTKNILKIVVPAIVSSMLGQLIYVINFIEVLKMKSPRDLAGLGLGQTVTQCLGIMIFFGLNSSLATKMSKAYGLKKLQLCGHYMN